MTKIQCAAGQKKLKALVKFPTVGSQTIVRTMVHKLSVNGSLYPQIQVFKEGFPLLLSVHNTKLGLHQELTNIFD